MVDFNLLVITNKIFEEFKCFVSIIELFITMQWDQVTLLWWKFLHIYIYIYISLKYDRKSSRKWTLIIKMIVLQWVLLLIFLLLLPHSVISFQKFRKEKKLEMRQYIPGACYAM